VGARLDKKSLLQRGPAKLRTNLDSLLTEKLIGDRPRALRWVKDNVKKDSAENIGFESLLDMFGIKYDEFKEFSDTVDSLIE